MKKRLFLIGIIFATILFSSFSTSSAKNNKVSHFYQLIKWSQTHHFIMNELKKLEDAGVLRIYEAGVEPEYYKKFSFDSAKNQPADSTMVAGKVFCIYFGQRETLSGDRRIVAIYKVYPIDNGVPRYPGRHLMFEKMRQCDLTLCETRSFNPRFFLELK